MKLKIINGLPLWHFSNLTSYSNVLQFTSTRQGGVSQGNVGKLNMSLSVNDASENVQENRRRLVSALGIQLNQLVLPKQTHSTNIAVVDAAIMKTDEEQNKTQFADTDALITNQAGLCLAVLGADCVPLLFYDPKKQVIGAAHAGWRGTVGLIAQKTILKMQEVFESQPQDILVCIGASISQEYYQVGNEVVQIFEQVFPEHQEIIAKRDEEGKAHINLWEANRQQLLQVGVLDQNIETARLCTYEYSNTFFSARRYPNEAGRFATGIMLKNITF